MQAAPPPVSSASSPPGPPHLGPSVGPSPCRQVTFLSDAGLGLADVLLGFVLIACFKNGSYLPTVQIIFQVASNCLLTGTAQLETLGPGSLLSGSSVVDWP